MGNVTGVHAEVVEGDPEADPLTANEVAYPTEDRHKPMLNVIILMEKELKASSDVPLLPSSNYYTPMGKTRKMP